MLARFLQFLALCCSFAASAQSRLPWEPPPTAEPVLRLPTEPREILNRYDIGASQLENFAGDEPLLPAEIDVLAKILFCFPRLGFENLHRWRRPAGDWSELAKDPESCRAQVFRVAGRARRVVQRKLLPEQAELFEFNHYYEVTVQLENSPHEALIAARHVPAAWPLDEPLDEPTQADALFLKSVQLSSEPKQLVFAAGSLGWYPDRPDPEHHIGPSQLALAKLGMDISQWDSVARGKGDGLTSADREGFYQLLAAVNGPEAAALPTHRQSSLNLVGLLQQPQEHFGLIVPVQGVAHRVMKVPVNDADIRSRFGVDHYYEIDFFLPLGGAALQFGSDPEGKKNPVYRNSFPATLLVRDLPPGLVEGENVHELIQSDSVFFKIWTYNSTYTSQFGQVQLAPLFVAINSQVVAYQSPLTWLTGGLITTALLLALAVAALIFWLYDRSDRAAKASSRRKGSEIRPDFSHLP
jgi:hypothetical protein